MSEFVILLLILAILFLVGIIIQMRGSMDAQRSMITACKFIINRRGKWLRERELDLKDMTFRKADMKHYVYWDEYIKKSDAMYDINDVDVIDTDDSK